MNLHLDSLGWWMFLGILLGLFWGYDANQSPRVLHIMPSIAQPHGEP